MSYDNLVIALAVAAAVPFLLALAPRVRLPGPVLEIVAGLVLGPAVLDRVRPDGTVEALSVIGLSFLLFLAGLEIDLERWRGPAARLVALGLAGTVALTAAVGWSLALAGLVESPLLVGIALAATSLGLLIPVLKDAGAADRPAGQLVIGGASAGEFCAVVLCRCSSPSA
ncbi:cation:proton antiporter [Streptomyces pseudogriseolus]|uniref:cation:proton antiporter n=1 Tax=Streptomyces pseudogriseolus TaxID=36817 RepID=UPI003FA1AE37